MDKFDEWLSRIQQPPRQEVANLDYWDFLLETRILQDAPAQIGNAEREAALPPPILTPLRLSY